MTRRPTHAAGPSGRKWEDPLMYGPSPRSVALTFAILFWALCVQVGLVLGLVTIAWLAWTR